MFDLSIRQRLLALAGTGLVLSTAIGAMGLYGLNRSIDDSVRLEQSTLAVRALMEADMLHDNTRAELTRAGLGAATQNPALVAEAEKAVAGDFQTLLVRLHDAEKHAPTEASRQAVQAVIPVAQAYRDSGLAQVARIRQQPAEATAALADFDTAFHRLEQAMEGGGDAIEKAAEELADATHQANERSRVQMLATFAGGLALLLGLSGWTVRAVMRPLRSLQAAVQGLNDGEADLSRRLPAAAAEFGAVSAGFNAFLVRIAEVVGSVQAAAREVSVASQQIARGNQDLSARTEHTAAGLQQAVQHVERIAQTVRQGAEAAQQASELADGASAVARRGGEAVARVVTTMAEINDSSRRISDIIGAIDGIAFQTNILALNAAVEAARAGEQGRGFAVVAGEVRTLAGRSAQAAREIKGLIASSLEKVEAGGQYVQQAGATMDDIVHSVQRVASTIATVTQASAEQSAGIAQVNQTVGELDSHTQRNAALVEQTAAAAEEMAEQAGTLAGTVAVFRTA